MVPIFCFGICTQDPPRIAACGNFAKNARQRIPKASDIGARLGSEPLRRAKLYPSPTTMNKIDKNKKNAKKGIDKFQKVWYNIEVAGKELECRSGSKNFLENFKKPLDKPKEL